MSDSWYMQQLEGQASGLEMDTHGLQKKVDGLARRLSESGDELEQERIRLAGCLTAAEGHQLDPPLKPGDYGWSPAYQSTFELREGFTEVLKALSESEAREAGLREAQAILAEGLEAQACAPGEEQAARDAKVCRKALAEEPS